MLGTHILSTASRAAAALAAAGFLAATPASATVIASLSFTTPTGTVSATDSIAVFLTLTLDASSDALITDEFGRLLSGLDDDDFAGAGIDPAEVAGSYINVFFQCGGNFGEGCIFGPPYDFDFQFNGSNISIAAGESYDFLFGTFTPTGGVAPPGTYTFYNAGLFGVPYDEEGNPFTDPDSGNDVTIIFGQTCPFPYSEECAFTRTVEDVSAVPEPASWAMMIAGFGAVGGAMRRRKAGYRLAYTA